MLARRTKLTKPNGLTPRNTNTTHYSPPKAKRTSKSQQCVSKCTTATTKLDQSAECASKLEERARQLIISACDKLMGPKLRAQRKREMREREIQKKKNAFVQAIQAVTCLEDLNDIPPPSPTMNCSGGWGYGSAVY